MKERQVGTSKLFSLLRSVGGCEWFWVALGQSERQPKISPVGLRLPSGGKWSYFLCSDSFPGLLLSVPSPALSPDTSDFSEVVKGQWRDVVDQGEKRSLHPFSAASWIEGSASSAFRTSTLHRTTRCRELLIDGAAQGHRPYHTKLGKPRLWFLSNVS